MCNMSILYLILVIFLSLHFFQTTTAKSIFELRILSYASLTSKFFTLRLFLFSSIELAFILISQFHTNVYYLKIKNEFKVTDMKVVFTVLWSYLSPISNISFIVINISLLCIITVLKQALQYFIKISQFYSG